MTSLLDWPMLTWSFGCTGLFDPTGEPSARLARFDTTSFMFMFVEVPEPVWKTSIGNSSGCLPCATSWAASLIARASFPSRRPSSAFACADAHLIPASAVRKRAGIRRPDTWKLSTARCVWAP